MNSGETALPHTVDPPRGVSITPADATDLQILAREQRAIELLAREAHTSIPKVQELFLLVYAKLTARARIQSFVPLLTSRCVRGLLAARNAMRDPSEQQGR